MHDLHDKPLVEKLVADGDALVLDAALSERFNTYLCEQPWIGLHLDWSVLSHRSFNLARQDASELEPWLAHTSVAKDDFIIIVTAASKPPVAFRREVLARQFDALVGNLPGPQWGFGATGEPSTLSYHFEHFIEYDGVETLYVHCDDAAI